MLARNSPVAQAATQLVPLEAMYSVGPHYGTNEVKLEDTLYGRLAVALQTNPDAFDPVPHPGDIVKHVVLSNDITSVYRHVGVHDKPSEET